MKILVTGGAGFVGSHIIEHLISMPDVEKIRVMDNLSTGTMDNIKPFLQNSKVEFFRADLRFISECRKAVKDMDMVCHQAAIGSVPRSIDDPINTHDNNINGFVNLLEASKTEGIRKVVYASSSSVYGDADYSPKVETTIGKPLSPYAVSKYANELYAEVFSKCYKMNIIGLRYFNVFGPRQNPFGPYAAVIPIFITSALTGRAPIINGDGSISRDFTYVDNVVKANINALFSKVEGGSHKVYNIALGGSTSLNELWEQIKVETGTTVDAIHATERMGDIRRSLADISAATADLHYTDLVDIKSGLKKTILWYQQQINS